MELRREYELRQQKAATAGEADLQSHLLNFRFWPRTDIRYSFKARSGPIRWAEAFASSMNFWGRSVIFSES